MNEMNDEPMIDSHLESDFEDRTHLEDEPHGWPGDGSGEDDFQDFNQNEAADYQNEGADDCHDEPPGCLGDE